MRIGHFDKMTIYASINYLRVLIIYSEALIVANSNLCAQPSETFKGVPRSVTVLARLSLVDRSRLCQDIRR
jgi:hypothetical protein